MYQKDYLLRIIAQAGAALRRAIAALREQRPDDALEATREALGLALDTDPATVMPLTGSALLLVMGAGRDPQPERLLLVGEILARRAEAFAALDDDTSAAMEAGRARTLLDEAVRLGAPEWAERAREIAASLPP